MSLKQYDETEPPYRLPDNMDVFTWSIPFVAEKVTNMLYNIVKRGAPSDGPEVDIEKAMSESDPKQRKRLVMKSKVTSVARVNRMYTNLREQSEMLL